MVSMCIKESFDGQLTVCRQSGLRGARHGSGTGLCRIRQRDQRQGDEGTGPGRSKGFGFVEMGSDAEAQAAIEGMHNQPLGGRSIVVNEARPMEACPPRSCGYGGGGGDRSGVVGTAAVAVATVKEAVTATATVAVAVAVATMAAAMVVMAAVDTVGAPAAAKGTAVARAVVAVVMAVVAAAPVAVVTGAAIDLQPSRGSLNPLPTIAAAPRCSSGPPSGGLFTGRLQCCRRFSGHEAMPFFHTVWWQTGAQSQCFFHWSAKQRQPRQGRSGYASPVQQPMQGTRFSRGANRKTGVLRLCRVGRKHRSPHALPAMRPLVRLRSGCRNH